MTDVKGVLILSRPSGIILRSAGALFATPSTPALPAAAEDDDAPRATNGITVTSSELARAYAKLAVNLVQSVGAEVREVEAGVSLTACLLWSGTERTSAGSPPLSEDPDKEARVDDHAR